MGSAIFLQCFLLVCISFVLFGLSDGSKCYNEKKSEWFSCPTEDDEPDATYCCYKFEEQHCCNSKEHASDDTAVILRGVVAAIAIVVSLVTLSCCILCCCALSPFCLLYKFRERRRRAAFTMTPMQPIASAQPRDEAGRPLYPVQQQQQYHPVAQPGYPPQPVPPSQAGQPNYPQPVGPYPINQLAEEQSLTSNQPFTYGAPKAEHDDYK